MNKKTTVYVVRHGESFFNSSGNLNLFDRDGEEGSPLNSDGKSQAKKFAEKLKGIEFAAIFSSNLARARETAQIIALERKLAVETSHLIRERSVYNYLHKINRLGGGSVDKLNEEIRKDLLKLDKKARMQYKHSPIMESVEEGALRLLTFIREAAAAYSGKKIMVVCHGNIMRCLLKFLGWAEFDEIPSGSIANLGYFVLESDGTEFFVKETHGITKTKGVIRDF
ncbi:MAG: histidine phosphatase family protein [Candidatus Levybacteria bacterium]|nr:histidine phosphatase family protein [Candidatus Levybacteria bacterium]